MNPKKLFLLPLLGVLFLLDGCLGPDAANNNENPWNQPRGFDTGIGGGDPRRR